MMTDNAPFHPELIEFLEYQFNWSIGKNKNFVSNLTRNTSLNYDLQIIGDDLYEALQWVASKGVDFSMFESSQYNPDEATFDCLHFHDRLIKKIPYFKKRLEKYRPLTLGQIERALITKIWNDDELTLKDQLR